MLNRIVILLVLAGFFVLAWFSPAPDRNQMEEGYVSLFNGYSLDGWHTIGGESTFRAERGEIIGTHGPGENTFLRTEKTYSDFSLKMQMRWDELGNSGVLFRAQQREDGRAYGYQYELDHSDRAWTAGIYDEARRGWLQNLENNQPAREAVKIDDWNEIHIQAQGPVLKTWINGVPAADIIDVFDAEGFIALQVHSGDIGVMRWRNLRLKQLEGLGTTGDALDGRRQVRDFSLDREIKVCEQATRLLLRKARAIGGNPQFVELQLTSSEAQVSVQRPGKLTTLEALSLPAADWHRVRVVSQGQRMVVSVGDEDVARLDSSDLPDRGQLLIEAAPCAEPVELASLVWTDLTPRNAEPLFYETLDKEVAPVHSPEEALSTFRIAPGYQLELAAAEPLIGDPVAAAWDEYGRLYVVEMRSYMPDAYGTDRGTALGRVVRLEDTDGDGAMDTSEVFLDGLTYPRAVAVVNEGILIGEPPNLWLCELPEPGANCVNKRRLGDYGATEGDGNVEHLENKLLPGLDNWYYNSKSSRSLRIVDGKLESRYSLFRGQWGIAKDDVGRLYYNHNSNLITADFFAAEDIFSQESFSPVLGLGEVLTAPEEVYSVRVNPGVNRAYLDNTLRADGRLRAATSASGLTPYRANSMPALSGDIFVAEPAANVVAQFSISEQDIALKAEHRLYEDPDWGQREFIGSTDERFRPVDVINGPDGGLYLVDMYRGLIQDEHFLTEELREQVLQRELDAPIGLGRIWRVRAQNGDASPAVIPGGKSPAQLLALLSSDNGWVRDTAQRLLLKTPGKQTVGLKSLAIGDTTVPALHALWTLHGRGELDRATVLAVMASKDPHRQVQALRAGSNQLTQQDLLMLAGQPYAERVVMQLAFALGSRSAAADVQASLERILKEHGGKALIQQAVVRSLRYQEVTFLQRLVDGDLFAIQSEASSALLYQLALSAYRSVRPDLGSDEPAPASLNTLLDIVYSQTGDREWVQLAMLEGLYSITRSTGFKSAAFDSAPKIFTDSAVDETSPLWGARLKGRRAFTWPGDELAAGITPLSPNQMARMESGGQMYSACAACHGNDGAGISGLGPALADSNWVNGAPEHLGRIILQGFDTQRNGVMPPHGHLAELNDEGLAGLMLYLRRSWGNTADPISVEKTASIRQSSAARATPWTVSELEQVEVDRGYDRFAGEYKVSFVTMTFSVEKGELHVSVPMYGGGQLEEESDGVFIASLDAKALRIEFDINEDGSVPSLTLFTDGQKIPVKRK